MARSIYERFGDNIDWYKVGDEVEAAGLDIRAVDEALDQIRERASITIERLHVADADIHDLAALPARGMRVVGNSFWVTWEERRKYSGNCYVLVREPHHSTDQNAIAVYCKGRKVGYIPTATAQRYAPLLDTLPAEGFAVGGQGVGSGSKMTVNLPTTPALRSHANTTRRPSA